MKTVAESGVRKDGFIREFSVPYNGMEVKICVISGLANARTVMEQVKNGEKEYHLIEVMACRRGCVYGGGQPRRSAMETEDDRTAGIYREDDAMELRKCDLNPAITALYEGFAKGKEHELFHNHEFCAK